MTLEKLILIGCDDTVVLSGLLSSIKGATFPNHVISATRVSDLISIVKSTGADLIRSETRVAEMT